MEFKGRFRKDKDGKVAFDFGLYTKVKLKEFMKKNPGMPFELKPLLPESHKLRNFFEGAVCPLLTFYQEGMDHRNSTDVQNVREWLKTEFNAKKIEIGGRIHKIAQSTKRKLMAGFLERVLGYLEDNYAPPPEALNPAMYKDWRDRIYPFGGADTYIEHLQDLKILPPK